MIDFKNYSYELELDFSDSNYIPKIDMKQLDVNSRFIKLKLFDKGQEINIADRDLNFRIIFKKPDNTQVFETCEVVTGVENYLIAPVSANTLATEGIIVTELVIFQGATLFSSKIFYINCLKSLHTDKGTIESSNEYKGLLETILKAEQVLQELKDLNSITMLHHVINVQADNKTVTFADWGQYPNDSDIEVYLSGVKQIQGIDFNIDIANKSITMIGAKTFVQGDQVLLCAFRRINSINYKDPVISADKITLNNNILGANNVQTALENIIVKFNEYLLVTKYENEIGTVNNLNTANKTIVGAINELKASIDNLNQGGGNIVTNYRKLTDKVTLTQDTRAIVIPIQDYDPNIDELNVYISGAKAVEGVAYELNRATKMITCLNGNWNKDIQIYFEIIKFN